MMLGGKSKSETLAERVSKPVQRAIVMNIVIPLNIAEKPSEVAQGSPGTLPRFVKCESEEALYALLSSLNDAGTHAEVACLSDPNGAPFIAGLWDVDYAGTVHYVFTEGDSGQQHCHECAGCHGPNDMNCDYRSPAFPIVVVLTESPPAADTLDDSMTDWWATA